MLENSISLLFLMLLCVLVAKVDKSCFGTFWTPTILLIVPFTCVVSVNLLVGDMLGFAPLQPAVVAVWIAGALIFWGTGHLLRQIWVGRKIVEMPVNSRNRIVRSEGTAVWSMCGGLISIVLLMYAVTVLERLGGISALASRGFLDEWGFGWPAHVRTALIVVVIMVIGSTKKWTVSAIINLVLMLLVLLLYQSLGAILAPLIAGSLYRILRGTYVPRVAHFVGAVAACFLLFQLVYLIGWAAIDPSSLFKADVYAFFSLHFISYQDYFEHPVTHYH